MSLKKEIRTTTNQIMPLLPVTSVVFSGSLNSIVSHLSFSIRSRPLLLPPRSHLLAETHGILPHPGLGRSTHFEFIHSLRR